VSGPLVIGVDGGGTSTVAWLADAEGTILGRGTAGPSNAKAIGNEPARRALGAAIAAARSDSGIGELSIEVACLGLAGFDRPDDRAMLASWCQAEGWAGRLVPANDGDLVLAAGTPEGFGIALISGTGSIAVGRTPDGRAARAGGWGPLIGDEGSAYWVALEGLRLVARRFDGRAIPKQMDRLTGELCRAFGVESPSGIVSEIYKPEWDRARIAGLARIVVGCAEHDEEAWRLLIERPAFELAYLVVAVRDALHRDDPDAPDSAPLAMAGGFLLAHQGIRAEVLKELGDWVGPVGLVDEPVLGAVVLARRALG
jgi:N-acetylglucosamine kinase-like BadF-type ATPase